MVGREAFDRFFDPIELTNAIERLFGDRRAGSGMDIKKLAPDMRPTAGLDDAVAGKQLVEPGIAVGMDDAGERVEVGTRMFTFAVGRVAEQRGRRSGPGKRSLVADVDPEPPGLSPAGA